MSLNAEEKQKVHDQLDSVECWYCRASGCALVADLAVEDHGLPESENQWGVSGAYVRCDNCGHELHKDA